MDYKFAIVITTKNRSEDLRITLENLREYWENPTVECVVINDGSTDNTKEVLEEFDKIKVLHNEVSKGYLFSRNRLFEETTAPYIIFLDDDAHIISPQPLELIEKTFEDPNCGVLAFRIYWGKDPIQFEWLNEENKKVKGFVGCGHVWKRSAWNSIPNYPEWFEFYGEEVFASNHLLQKKIHVVYVPNLMVQHRVDMNARRSHNDFMRRQRRSLAAGWYLYLIFYPKKMWPRLFGVSVKNQLKKAIKGDFRPIQSTYLAAKDVISNFGNLKKARRPFNESDLQLHKQCNPEQIYWYPKR